MKNKTLTLVVLALGTITVLHSADWPQWLGPQRNGVSTETGLLKEWPKEGPKLVWQNNDVGDGYGSPAVAGNRIFLMGSQGVENEFVRALSAQDGKILWTTQLGKVGNPDQAPNYPTARSTPTVDGASVYALSSDGDLAAVEAATGKLLWKKSLRADFGGVPHTWAYAESPLIDGDTVVVSPGGSQATLVALNKNTGAVIWKSAIPGGESAGYASAIVVDVAGHRQYVQLLSKGLVGVDAKSGQLLWRYDEVSKGQNYTTPVFRDGTVYSGAQGIGGGMVRLKAQAQGVEAEKVYYTRGTPNTQGGYVLLGQSLYGASGKALVASDFATGNVLWMEPSIGSGSVLLADGRLYFHGHNGDVTLVEPTPEGYREKGRFTPPGVPARIRRGESSWPYPALANGRLYIRDLGTLWAFDVKAN